MESGSYENPEERTIRYIESVERKPNEPAELFIARIIEEAREASLLPFYPLNSADTFTQYPNIQAAFEKKIASLDTGGYVFDQKFVQPGLLPISEMTVSRAMIVPEEELRLTDPAQAKETFRKTLHQRMFFNTPSRKGGGLIRNLFLVSTFHTPEMTEYMERRLNDKTIVLVGGGNSCEDLVEDHSFSPKKFINIDPFIEPRIKDEKTLNAYRHIHKGIEDENILEDVGVQQVDEIWATFSVPIYSRTKEDIQKSFKHMVDMLSVGGTLRIYPLSVGPEEGTPANKALLSDSLYHTLDEVVESLNSRQDLNVFCIRTHDMSGYTLFVQKIK